MQMPDGKVIPLSESLLKAFNELPSMEEQFENAFKKSFEEEKLTAEINKKFSAEVQLGKLVGK